MSERYSITKILISPDGKLTVEVSDGSGTRPLTWDAGRFAGPTAIELKNPVRSKVTKGAGSIKTDRIPIYPLVVKKKQGCLYTLANPAKEEKRGRSPAGPAATTLEVGPCGSSAYDSPDQPSVRQPSRRPSPSSLSGMRVEQSAAIIGGGTFQDSKGRQLLIITRTNKKAGPTDHVKILLQWQHIEALKAMNPQSYTCRISKGESGEFTLSWKCGGDDYHLQGFERCEDTYAEKAFKPKIIGSGLGTTGSVGSMQPIVGGMEFEKWPFLSVGSKNVRIVFQGSRADLLNSWRSRRVPQDPGHTGINFEFYTDLGRNVLAWRDLRTGQNKTIVGFTWDHSYGAWRETSGSRPSTRTNSPAR